MCLTKAIKIMFYSISSKLHRYICIYKNNLGYLTSFQQGLTIPDTIYKVTPKTTYRSLRYVGCLLSFFKFFSTLFFCSSFSQRFSTFRIVRNKNKTNELKIIIK